MDILKDQNFFFIMQVGLIFLCLFCFSMRKIIQRCEGVKITVIRRSKSMAIFTGVFVTLNGIFIGLDLSVDVTGVKDYRTFWVILDTVLIGYTCLINPWSRNKLVNISNELEKESMK